MTMPWRTSGPNVSRRGPGVSGHTVIIAVVATTAALLAGCSDPKFKKQKAVRDERIKAQSQAYGASESQRLKEMKQTIKQQENMSRRHRKQLEAQWKEMEKRYAKQKKDWRSRRPAREQQYKKILGGKPEQIPGTFAEMAY